MVMDIDALLDVLRVSAVWLFATWLIAAGVSVVLGGFVLVMLPATYLRDELVRPDARRWWSPGRLGRLGLGVLLLGLGALLTLPGVPGHGLWTMFAGLRLLAPSTCRRLERTVARRRGVLTRVNQLRVRFGRPPLLPPLAA
jgi:hypothetical protein